MMKDENKTKSQLIEELAKLRQQNAELKTKESEHKQTEDALRESAEQFRSLAESSTDYIMRYDRQFRHIYANEACLRVSGKEKEEYIGKTHREMDFNPELVELWEKRIQAVFDTGESQQEIFEWEGAEGKVVLDWRVMPEFSIDGKVHSVLGVSRDITALKQVEETLREGETLLKKAESIAQIGTWQWNPSTQEVKWSDEMFHLFDIQPEEFDGTLAKGVETIHPDDVERASSASMAALETKEPYQVDYRIVRSDGSITWLETRGEIICDEKGDIVEIIGTVQDITARKQAEKDLQIAHDELEDRAKNHAEALQEVTTRQMEIIRATHVGLWDWDLTTDRVHYSAEWKKLIGYEEYEIGDAIEEWRSRVHPDDVDLVLEEVQLCITEARQDYQTEFRFRHKDGSYRWIMLQASILQDKTGHPIRMRGSQVDITEYKRIEEELKASERRLANSQHAAKVGSYEWNLLTDEVVWSDGMFRIFGIDKGTFAPTVEDFASFIHPDDLHVLSQENFEQAIRSPYHEMEYRIIDQTTREVKSIHLWGEVITDSEGKPIRIYGTLQDITGRKQAEEALRKSETKYRNLFAQIADPVFIFEQGSNRFIDGNQSVIDQYGYSLEELRTMTPHQLHPPEEREEVEENIRDEGDSATHGYVHITKDGKKLHVEVRTAELEYEGQEAWISIVRDVTGRKQAEEALRRAQKIRNAEMAVRIKIAEMDSSAQIFDVVQEISSQLNDLETLHDACSLQVINDDQTGYISCRSQSTEDDRIRFLKALANPTNAPLPYLIADHPWVLEVWQSGQSYYQACTQGDSPVPPGISVVDVAFSHGTLAINRRQPDAFSSDDIHLLERFASVLSEGFQRFLDIAERKRAEDELKKSEKLLRTIAENYPRSYLSIIESDYTAGFTSGQEFKKQNLDPELFVGLTLEQVFGDQVVPIQEQYERTFKGEERTFELFFNDQYQQYRTIPLYAEDGSIPRILSVAENITERKQAEEERLLHESRLRALYQLSHMWEATIEEMAEFVLEEIVHLTRSKIGFFGFMNADESVMDIYAWSKEAMEECAINAKLLHFPIQDAGLWAEAVRQRQPVIINDYSSHPCRKGCPPGHVALGRFLSVPILFNNRIMAVAAVGNKQMDYDESDIHQLSLLGEEIWRIQENRRMGEELIRTQRLRASSELSAGISHNLNNILTGVLMPAHFLKQKANDPELHQEIDEIITYGQRARDLVHRLHLSVRGVEEDELEPVSINEVIPEAVQTARPKWKDEPESRGIDVEIDMQPKDVPAIRGTRSSVHDILTNLIFNAVDAMPEGGTITVATQFVDKRVQLIFSDTGIGMDEETKSRIFEPFFTTKMDIGTGLGLSTVYNTLEQWGGEIQVESVPGEGTTFTIHLSLWQEAGISQEETRDIFQARPGKVLIIDDDEGICSILSRLIGQTHEVETAIDGGQVLEEFVPGHYDAALIDLGMSGMPGNRVAQEIRQRDPMVSTILITGWELSEDDARRGPFDLEIRKPFGDLDEIHSVVAQAITLHDERMSKGN